MNQANRDRKTAWKAAQKESARNDFPLSHDLLQSLFEFVEMSVEAEGCDHTNRFTREWHAVNHQDFEQVVCWLEANGGFCDCEVVANAMEHWEENRSIVNL